MATSMLNSYRPTQFPAQSLEDCIRLALESGKLSASLKARINDFTHDEMTVKERVLLQILQDAIADGCIQDQN